MFVYVTATWLIANLIHPFMLIVVFGWEAPFDFDMNTFGFVFQFILYSFVFAIPSLAFAQLAMYGIFKLPLHNTGKYITWLFIAPVLVFLNYWLLAFLFGGAMYIIDSMEFILPAMLSAVAAILIRFTYFFRMADALSKIKNEEELKNSDESY